jgi:hypothetical protein
MEKRSYLKRLLKAERLVANISPPISRVKVFTLAAAFLVFVSGVLYFLAGGMYCLVAAGVLSITLIAFSNPQLRIISKWETKRRDIFLANMIAQAKEKSAPLSTCEIPLFWWGNTTLNYQKKIDLGAFLFACAKDLSTRKLMHGDMSEVRDTPILLTLGLGATGSFYATDYYKSSDETAAPAVVFLSTYKWGANLVGPDEVERILKVVDFLLSTDELQAAYLPILKVAMEENSNVLAAGETTLEAIKRLLKYGVDGVKLGAEFAGKTGPDPVGLGEWDGQLQVLSEDKLSGVLHLVDVLLGEAGTRELSESIRD